MKPNDYLKNIIAVFLFNKSGATEEKMYEYLEQIEELRSLDISKEDYEKGIDDLSRVMELSFKQTMYFSAITFVNKHPIFTVILIIGVLYNIAFYSIKLLIFLFK